MTTWYGICCTTPRAVGVLDCPHCGAERAPFLENGEGPTFRFFDTTDGRLVAIGVRDGQRSGTNEASDRTEDKGMPKITKAGASMTPADANVRSTDDPNVLAVATENEVVRERAASAELRAENVRLRREVDEGRIAAGEKLNAEQQQQQEDQQQTQQDEQRNTEREQSVEPRAASVERQRADEQRAERGGTDWQGDYPTASPSTTTSTRDSKRASTQTVTGGQWAPARSRSSSGKNQQ